VSEGAILRMHGVRKAFGGHIVLDGLDLEVPRGTNVVLMGRSGTGKSVTLKTMCGLLRPDSGTVEVDGTRIDRADRRTLADARKKMGFVFQGAALIAWMSARDNVALPLREAGVPEREVRERVERRLAEVGLSDIGDKFPSEISGGMRKRVGFARATVTSPSLVLYDEPTTGLDPMTTRTIDELINEARDRLGATGVIVSHDVDSALRVADRIGLLHQGRIDALLTPDEFRVADHPVIRAFVRDVAPVGPATGGNHEA